MHDRRPSPQACGHAQRGMTERCGCKPGPYTHAGDAPDHPVATAVHGILSAACVSADLGAALH